jgi:uncharacterized phage protein gp47/JayE
MTLSAQITAAGIVTKPFSQVLSELQDLYRGIYGDDIYIAPDSQDGQFLALLATAISDCNDAAANTFNSFSPSYSQGAQLASLVKLNSLTKQTATKSTATGTITGQAGVTITGGVVKDVSGNAWDVPTTTIPGGGSITVTVTAQQPGAITAPSGSINKISTIVPGWQSFVSTGDAAPGAPVELDAALRRRQSVSTQANANGPLDALYAALSNLPGVQRVATYQNDTSAADANGIAAKSICVVIQGGTAADIARTIAQKKPPACGTYGTTNQNYTDARGTTSTLHYYVLTLSTINVHISATVTSAYASTTTPRIQQAVADFINSRNIGQTVEYGRLWSPAYLNGDPLGKTYKITAMTMAIGAGSQATADLAIAFNAAAFADPSNVTLTLT